MVPKYDAVIVGAGLAGLQCARLLASRGRRVLLMDRKPSLSRAVHTTGIFVRRTLEDFALPEQFLGPPVRHVTLYSPARRALALESPHDEFRVGRMGALYDWSLDRCRDAGVDVALDTRYAGSHAAGGGRSVVCLESQRRCRKVECRFLVGCDGAASRVAADLGLSRNSEWIVGAEQVFDGVRLDGPPAFHCFLDPRIAPGYIGWLVHDGEEVHVGVGGYPTRFRPLEALESFRDSLTGLADLRGRRPVERRSGSIPVGGVLPHLAGPRGLLVGDAAGAVSPLTAGGLDPCLRMTHAAVESIHEFLETGHEAALARYDGARFRARFRGRRLLRRLLAGCQSPLLMEAACRVLFLPGFRLLARSVFFGAGSFPDVVPASRRTACPVGATVGLPK